MDMETAGREETEADMRLKKDALAAGGGSAGSDMLRGGRADDGRWRRGQAGVRESWAEADSFQRGMQWTRDVSRLPALLQFWQHDGRRWLLRRTLRICDTLAARALGPGDNSAVFRYQKDSSR